MDLLLAAGLHDGKDMQLAQMTDHCRALEERAASVYRAFAAASRHHPEACALWTALAREEEQHARSLATARLRLAASDRPSAQINGWEEAMREAEERLAAAERLGPGAGLDERLAAALEVEMSEIETMRRMVVGLADPGHMRGAQVDHAVRLADAASKLSEDPQVRLAAAVVRARALLREHDCDG
jgi:rubrerythrin